MMSTLSCSTSFAVAFTATSGLASDEALMISIFLPPGHAVVLLQCKLGATHAIRTASGERPFQCRQQSDLHVSCADAAPENAARTAVATSVRTNALLLICCLLLGLMIPTCS
jgi:hypothetical protein